MTTAWTIDGVKAALAEKKISARELTSEFYKRIETRNPELNAYLKLSPERARKQADKVDALIAAGKPLPPLAGVPIAIKDVISTRGITTTCGSKILENYVPPFDATAVERLDAAGAVILGKTNCDEFAMGSSNENSAYGAVRNPASTDRVPGGSSGGSAAAVAAGLAVASLGHGHRRIDTPAWLFLRYPGDDGQLRPRFPLWIDRLRFVPRSHRSLRNKCERCRRGPACNRRPRPQRFDFHHHARTRLSK